MAFTETLGSRTILAGVGGVQITLSGSVYAGDPLGYNSGWVLSASASTIQPLLIAGTNGNSGDRIIAYPMAIVKVANTLANTPAAGDKVALTDGGLYAAAGAGLPDVGYVASIASDSLSSVLCLCPAAAQLTVVRS